MKYRPEINGLRTLAVLPVVLYHAGAQGFSGGYIGVDIFFVISGYLITSILIIDLSHDNFSIIKFYEKRARRILPALFFVMLCTIPFSWLWLSPPSLLSFSKSILSVIFFVSNFFFWSESGYFDVGGENKPLLHTWSLAVEEQYYLLFPILLLFLWPLGRRNVFFVIGALILISFLFGFFQLTADPSGNFFLPFSRAWELLGGSICALILSARNPSGNQILSLIGCVLILLGIFIFNASTPWPSIFTVIPIFGTMLIILYARQNTIVGRLLSMRALVGVGLISYSLYLWHQPVLVFARLHLNWTPGSKRLILLSLLCIPLAWASWRFIEAPFRRHDNSWFSSQKSIFISSIFAAVLFGAFAIVGVISKGTMYRYPPEFGIIIGASEDKPSNECLLEPSTKTIIHPVPRCLHHSKDGKTVDVMVLGDSHGWALSEELRSAMEKEGINYYYITHQGCIPVPGVIQMTYGDPTSCMRFVEGAIEYAREANIKTIVLVGRFTKKLEQTSFDNGEGGREDSPQEASLPTKKQLEKTQQEFVAGLNNLRDDFEIVILEPIPEAGWNVPKIALERSQNIGHVVDVTTSYAVYKDRNKTTLTLLSSILSDRVYLVSTENAFCSETTGRCLNTKDGVPLYIDNNHLSNSGARLLVPALMTSISEAITAPSERR